MQSMQRNIDKTIAPGYWLANQAGKVNGWQGWDRCGGHLFLLTHFSRARLEAEGGLY
jgi:hypothetical protein